MKQLSEYFAASVAFLEKRGIPNPKRSAEELLASLLGIKRMDVYLQFERPLNDTEVAALRETVQRRGHGEPVEYIVGSVEFDGLMLKTDSRALIPRPETELLLHHIHKKYQAVLPQNIADICTGTGCLALALKKRYPESSVVATDISEQALTLARENGEAASLEVSFLCGDLAGPLEKQSFDLIVSNPPYISKKEYQELSPTVVEFEPKIALLAEDDGLAFYARLAETLPNICRENALVALELGTGQGDAVKALFTAPHWKHPHVEQDWNGHDRFFFIEFTKKNL